MNEPTGGGSNAAIDLVKMVGRIDQTITAHSALRDQYETRSDFISIAIIVASTVITVLSLSSDAVRAVIMPSGILTDHLLGLLGLVVLILSILELKFGWRERAAKHGEAAAALSRLKLLMNREKIEDPSLTREKFEQLQSQYESLSDLIAKIPEANFLKLKGLHKRKVEISKLLDSNPGASVPLLRIRLWFRDNFRKLI